MKVKGCWAWAHYWLMIGPHNKGMKKNPFTGPNGVATRQEILLHIHKTKRVSMGGLLPFGFYFESRVVEVTVDDNEITLHLKAGKKVVAEDRIIFKLSNGFHRYYWDEEEQKVSLHIDTEGWTGKGTVCITLK